MKAKHQILSAVLVSLTVSMCALSPSPAETSVGGSTNPTARTLFDSANKKMSSGDNAGALVDLTQAITLDPKYGKAIANRAAARFNLHDYKGAISDLDAALKFFPNMPFLVDLRAKSENALHAPAEGAAQPQIDRQQANNMLRQAILGGDFADPSTMLMMQAQRAGMGVPRAPVVNPFAAHPLVSNQPVDLTPGVTKEIKERGDGNTAATSESSRLAAMMQSTPGAESSPSTAGATTKPADNQQSFQDQLNAASNSGGDKSLSAKEYYDQGCRKSLNQDFAGAISDFDHAIALDPKNGDAWANRGLARLHIRAFPQALKDFEEADRLIPNNPQLKQFIDFAKKASGQ
ncbi:MAG TPA: tetratricopeptide repeat protein [Trichormus sp.]|jgi:tetratricopeptide (TPR) repeat protein